MPRVCAPTAAYHRQPTDTVLYRTVEAHLKTFLAHTAGDAERSGLPVFVKREFEAFLQCGILAHGFARVRCEGCAFERLVPFSCKGRGFCPSCGGRRMTAHAAQLVEAVLPPVPVRQWVLTLPYRLRYRLAWDHGLTRAVLGVYTRVLQDFYSRSAHQHGIAKGRTGMLTVIQRFGSGVNLNVHFHTLVLDGVFIERTQGQLEFHAAMPPSDAAVTQVLAAIRHRVRRLLARRGLEPDAAELGPLDGLAEVSPILAQILSASVQGRVALGQPAGTRVGHLGGASPGLAASARGPRQAHLDGFDLHANVRVPPNDRAQLEHLCRYVLRPPLVQDRVELRADGRLVVKLKAAWRDGTRHLVFERSTAGQAAGTGRPGGGSAAKAERRQQPPHGVRFGHHAEDPARAPAALADQDLDREQRLPDFYHRR